MDPRIEKAADILVKQSCKVVKGERVIISTDIAAKDLALACYKRCLLAGAIPKIRTSLPGAAFLYYTLAKKPQIMDFPEEEFFEIKRTDCIIYLNAPENTRELSNTAPSLIGLRRKVVKEISDWRVQKTRWVLFNFPSDALAQEADMSLEEYTDFVFKATNIDWAAHAKKYEPLKRILDRGKEVHIVGEDTDIWLDITGRTAINSSGRHNVPDGEVFMGPVETKTEGHIRYTFPAIYGGREVQDVRLEFKKGKVVKATAAKNEQLLKTLIKTDKGACMLGELGVGTNFMIDRFVKQILFDEKIGGTIHLALGMAYKEGGGVNESAIHWDMIKDLRKGGRLEVDGKTIQKDGKFLF
ncbi:MAG: aminopeptidase [Nanoarchaeota archaeon]